MTWTPATCKPNSACLKQRRNVQTWKPPGKRWVAKLKRSRKLSSPQLSHARLWHLGLDCALTLNIYIFFHMIRPAPTPEQAHGRAAKAVFKSSFWLPSHMCELKCAQYVCMRACMHVTSWNTDLNIYIFMAPLSCLDSRMHACMLIVNAFMSHVFACISSMPTCMHVTCMICVYVPQQQEFAMLHRKVSMVEPMLPLPSLRPLRGPLPQPLCIVYITFFGRRLSSTTLADGTMVSVPVEKKSGYDKHDWQSSPKYPYDAWRGGVIDINIDCRLRRFVNNVKRSSAEVREMWDGTTAQRASFAFSHRFGLWKPFNCCSISAKELNWNVSCWRATETSNSWNSKWNAGPNQSAVRKRLRRKWRRPNLKKPHTIGASPGLRERNNRFFLEIMMVLMSWSKANDRYRLEMGRAQQ